MKRVIGNMMRNAVEGSLEKETVTIGCKIFDEEVEFWIHNNAVIPDDVQLQIFQRSFTTKGSGRGLGTYLMKLLCERYLKGKVSFVSEPETGTVFTVRLPIILSADKKKKPSGN